MGEVVVVKKAVVASEADIYTLSHIFKLRSGTMPNQPSAELCGAQIHPTFNAVRWDPGQLNVYQNVYYAACT